MNNEVRLSSVAPGRRAVVSVLNTPGGLRRRLMDIGLIEATEVECLGRSPLGDPSAYLIRGAVIALRSEDSNDILVRPL